LTEKPVVKAAGLFGKPIRCVFWLGDTAANSKANGIIWIVRMPVNQLYFPAVGCPLPILIGRPPTPHNAPYLNDVFRGSFEVLAKACRASSPPMIATFVRNDS
jgi:hypothetical protein